MPRPLFSTILRISGSLKCGNSLSFSSKTFPYLIVIDEGRMGKVMAMEERKNTRGRSHNVILENREKLSVSGVEHVNSFNNELILVETVAGVLTIKGEELDVNKLNLEDGNVIIEGIIQSMVYSERDSFGSKGSSFLGKLFK